MELDAAKRKQLVDAIKKAFLTAAAVESWLAEEFDENVGNMFVGASFDDKIAYLVTWANARGAETLLQKLADRPPGGSVLLQIEVASISGIRPANADFAPVAPHVDWFVTKRPFANRKGLRAALQTFDQAAPGADSVLVIEGDRFSGKSYGVRFARQCAPPGRFVSVDVAQYYEGQMNVAELVHAIDRHTERHDFPSFDKTKEAEAVPRMVGWITAKLSGPVTTWLIVDHCDRPNLTDPARELLLRLATNIEDGTLTNVKLILADIDRKKLPAVLRGSRHDRAILPNQKEVEEWCQGLATHLGQGCTEEQIKAYAKDVFAGLDGLDGEAMAPGLEQGLARAYLRIKAWPDEI